jgi:phenylalanyl-tRNA synthetase beta chain
MKLSYNWLKQYVDIDVSPDELSIILTDVGLEVEGLEKFQSVKGGLEGVVVGEVLTCSKHPNADKLSVTTVDVGQETPLPIVCGAPNVAAGQKVLVATVGTLLYSGEDSFEIKKAKIRGEVSQGMICAEDELGLGTSHDGIMVLDEDVQVGIPANQVFEVEEDHVYEIGLTPNRADAASHFGAARDLVAGLNRLKNTDKYHLHLPSVEDFHVENHDLDIDVIVEDTVACPRYVGVTLSNIEVKESPDWLKNRLNAIGLRPINNIVDVTNYVLHETGQPLHAFDAAEIKGNKVVIRKMSQDTAFITLDEVERKLDSNDLMICNESDGMCIAGVFGGIDSGVTEKTKNIFLESAYFDPTHVRKTSRRHQLQTDASFRFERGVDPNITSYALQRAILLFQEVAGGQVSSEIKDVYPQPIEPWDIRVSYRNVDRLIGKVIEREAIKKILTDLDIEVMDENDNGFIARIPTNKVDVTREADVIEEIIRIYGFNNIDFENQMNISVNIRQKPDPEKIQNLIAGHLTAKGFAEMLNNSLTNSSYYDGLEEDDKSLRVMLANPLSQDLDMMRKNLLFGGLEVIAYNNNRRISDLKLYEFGKTYHKKGLEKQSGLKNFREEKFCALFTTGRLSAENWNTTDAQVDFYYLKGIVEGILQKLGFMDRNLSLEESKSKVFPQSLTYVLGEKVIAEVSVVSKSLLESFDIKNAVYIANLQWDKILKMISVKEKPYQPVPKFPTVRRDLALLVDKDIRFEDLKTAALKTERKLLKEVGLFDIYEGEKIPRGKKSYALSFMLLDEDRTLTDKVIDKTMRKIQMTLEKNFDASLR